MVVGLGGSSIGKAGRSKTVNDATAIWTLNQCGSGILLDLQQAGVAKFTVKNDGQVDAGANVNLGANKLTFTDAELLRTAANELGLSSGDAFAYSVLRDILINKGRLKILATNAGWTSTTTAGGSTSQLLDQAQLTITTAASARGMLSAWLGLGLNPGASGGRVNWDKELLIVISLARTTADANNVLTGYIQVKTVVTYGVLGAKGIELVISGTNGLALTGAGYGTARGTVSIGTLTAGYEHWVVIHHRPGVAIDFYLDGAAAVSITTAANIPSGSTDVGSVLSLDGGTGTSATCYLGVAPMLLWQAR